MCVWEREITFYIFFKTLSDLYMLISFSYPSTIVATQPPFLPSLLQATTNTAAACCCWHCCRCHAVAVASGDGDGAAVAGGRWWWSCCWWWELVVMVMVKNVWWGGAGFSSSFSFLIELVENVLSSSLPSPRRRHCYRCATSCYCHHLLPPLASIQLP